MELLLDIFMDALIDSIKLLPFLLLTYLLMEYLEHKTSTKTRAWIRKAGKLGPVAGGIAGIFPQCGFSVAASNLYSGGIITMGTLVAVFLSTSDEMLPIFLSESVDVRIILEVLGIKLVTAVITGFLVDFAMRFRPNAIQYKNFHTMCESEHCHCEKGIVKSACNHTIKILLFIFLFSLVMNFLIEIGGEDRISGFLSSHAVFGPLFAAIVGLIPNCAASVLITQMYLGGILDFGSMISGLLVGAGVGLLVLFRTNKRWKENLSILGVVWVSGVFWGVLVNLFVH
ncbi:MAG: putative manganese transporter [Eubacterium sp.]